MTHKNAFTLVELIVVITILAILGTIAFISLQGYSKSSRDSVRISDVSNMKTSLELFHLNAGKYPLPDDLQEVTFSGNTLWSQGEFGNNVVSSLSRNLAEVPTDPLTDKKYIYSVANNKNEYEILSLLESDLALNPINQTNAATIIVTPRIDGTFNGVFIKTPHHIVPVPSIINSEVGGAELVLNQFNIQSQVISNGGNIPNQGNVNYSTGDLDINLSVWTGSIDDNSSDSDKEDAMLAIQGAYIGSILANEIKYANILSKIETEDIVVLFNTIVLNDGTIEIVINGVCGVDNGGDFSSEPTNLCDSGNSSDMVDNGELSTYDWTCNGGDLGTNINCSANHISPFLNCTGVNTPTPSLTTTTYGSCNTADIIVCSGNGIGYIIAACNVGTNTSATSYNDSDGYGELFQWGNNSGIKTAPISPTQILVTATGSTYGSGTFIYDTADWNTTLNDNLWGNGTNTDISRKGPCLDGYHIPSQPEWVGIHTAGGWGTNGSNMSIDLKLPAGGFRNLIDASLSGQGSSGYYWSSSPSAAYGYIMLFSTANVLPSAKNNRANGFSIRCFKN